MVKIRLTRLGDLHSPFYRVVVADSRSPRDGKVIEVLGTYDPLKTPALIKVDVEKVDKWVKNGAIPTETAKSVLVTAGYKFPVKAKKEKKKAKKAAVKTAAAKQPAKETAKPAAAKKPAAKKA